MKKGALCCCYLTTCLIGTIVIAVTIALSFFSAIGFFPFQFEAALGLYFMIVTLFCLWCGLCCTCCLRLKDDNMCCVQTLTCCALFTCCFSVILCFITFALYVVAVVEAPEAFDEDPEDPPSGYEAIGGATAAMAFISSLAICCLFCCCLSATVQSSDTIQEQGSSYGGGESRYIVVYGVVRVVRTVRVQVLRSSTYS